MNRAMKTVSDKPEMTVVLRLLSKVKTRWRTVATAMSMERSSPVESIRRVSFLTSKGKIENDARKVTYTIVCSS